MRSRRTSHASRRIRLSRHRRHAPLPARLRRRAGADAEHEAWRDPEDPAHQRPAAQPRYPAQQPLASAPVQQHEPPFPRRALQPERHRRQRHALDGAPTSCTTSTSRCPRTTRAAPTGTIRITTARPMCRWRAAWRVPSSSKATRRCAGDRPGARACHAADAGRVRRLLHDRGLRHTLSGNLDALPGDQRPAAADHRHAARGGAALAPGRLAVPGQHAAGARQAPAERHRLRRHPAGHPAGDEAAANLAGTARRCAGTCGRSGHLRTERHAVRSGSSVAHRTAGARGRSPASRCR